MSSFSLPALAEGMRLEVLQVDAAPLIRRVLDRLDLPGLFERHLPLLPGRPADVPSSTILCALLSNLLLARQPLYAMSAWAATFVPEHLGLLPGQAALLNDDRCGRSFDHLWRSKRASLFTAIALGAIHNYELGMRQFHQDTTTVTVTGEYANQPPVADSRGPARICRGYNKDHRPDLKQLVYDRVVTADGAVPIHCKVLDGNTTDDTIHQRNWLTLYDLVGDSDFLYVADSKLASKTNLAFIAKRNGRFLTVMPRTHKSSKRFHAWIVKREAPWVELWSKPSPRGKDKPKVRYWGYEDPKGSKAGYRIFWYLSSQKKARDAQARTKKVAKTRQRLERLRPRGRGGVFRSEAAARQAVARVLAEAKVRDWLRVEVDEQVQVEQVQVGPGRPGPDTQYQTVTHKSYTIRVEANQVALTRAARCDGTFPLLSNDKSVDLKSALEKYKYQPYVEKRHEQMKSVFEVMPVWLKSPKRVESLLWLYHLVDLVQALVEREVRRKMREADLASLPLYPEARHSKAPTAEMVLRAFQGHRRYRLLDKDDREVLRFHDPLSEVAETLVTLLDIDRSTYGLPRLGP